MKVQFHGIRMLLHLSVDGFHIRTDEFQEEQLNRRIEGDADQHGPRPKLKVVQKISLRMR